MALLAYNKTTSPLALLEGNPAPTLPASPTGGVPGVPFNVTSELRPDLTVDPVNGVAGGLLGADYVNLETQVTATDVAYEWTSDPEYLTPGLTITALAGFHAASHQNGGLDEISVAGLSGALADAQTPTAHAADHTDGTDDVADLVGDSGAGGTHGLTPAPAAGDAAAGKFLKADASWAVPDTVAHSASHESGGADVLSLTPDMDAVADAEGLSTLLTIHKSFAAVGGAAADDVVLYTADSPFQFRIVDVIMRVTTLKAGGTLQLRDAAAGAGNVLSKAFATDAVAMLREDGSATSYASSLLAASSSLVLRRSDNDAAGEVTILLRKE